MTPSNNWGNQTVRPINRYDKSEIRRSLCRAVCNRINGIPVADEVIVQLERELEKR